MAPFSIRQTEWGPSLVGGGEGGGEGFGRALRPPETL